MLTETHTRRHPLLATCLQALAVILLLQTSCRSRQGNAAVGGKEPRLSPLAYAEGDTLDALATPVLDVWTAHYRPVDTAFRRSAFRASGILLALDSLEPCLTPDSIQLRRLSPILAWSPDSSQAIDIWSYDYTALPSPRGGGRLEGGGPDQGVKWLEIRSGTARQLLFHGPGQLVESVDWVAPDALVLGLLSFDPTTGDATPDLILIHLREALFTNFRYLGPPLPATAASFSPAWLLTQQFEIE
ncbi:MAG: hypothetical protein FJX89_10925 [Bacteroidetes bacterium]|nr:hypothetical protein [Bacteroidota bacterium]